MVLFFEGDKKGGAPLACRGGGLSVVTRPVMTCNAQTLVLRVASTCAT